MARPLLRKDVPFHKPKGPRRTRAFRPLPLLLALLVLGGMVWYQQWQADLAPVDAGAQPLTITIPQGADLPKISQVLAENKVIRDAGSFNLFVRWQGNAHQMKAGTYTLSGAMSAREILDKLTKGQTDVHTVTFPEGFTTKQVAKRLEEAGLINPDAFWKEVREGEFPHEFIRNNPKTDTRLEGYLFPATYKIEAGTSEHQILTMMLDRFAKELTPETKDQLFKQNLSVHQWVTMASLVEREARKAEDRPVIAGVFYNRLKKNMRLESCATVQYVIGFNKPVLSVEDTKIDSPYNTYQKDGLPPTPIANPGASSLKAALNPTPSDYLYFLAKPDGSSHFSKTLSEHNAAMARYNVR